MADGDAKVDHVRSNVGRMVFDAALAIIVGATGWYVSVIYGEIKDLKSVDIQIRAEAASDRVAQVKEFVRKDDYRIDISEMKRILERIEGKMDGKQDRSAIGLGIERERYRSSITPTWRDGREVNR